MKRTLRMMLAVLVWVASACAQTLDGLETFVAEQMKEWKVPGVALVVVKDGQIIHSKGYGFRNLKDQLPVTPKTLFAIGSSTKAFTAITLAQLVDDGKLDWDKPVRDYLPDFRLYDQTATERLTPRDLVSHRSGLPRHDLMWYSAPFTRDQLYQRLRYLEPSKDIRTTFQYQNLMFMTAGYLAGRLQDMPWEDAVRRRIFQPLGMTASGFSVSEMQKAPDYALPYKKNKEEVVEAAFRNIDAIGPAGSINSNIEDMAKYLLMNLNGGKLGDKQVLSKAQADQTKTVQMPIASQGRWTELGPSSYGMGWMLTTYHGHSLVHHGGNIDGFSALVTFMPRDQTGMVILTNMNGSALPGLISYNVYDRLLSLDQIPWTQRLRDDEKKAKEGEEEAKKKQYTAQRAGTRPSHELKEYAGDYEHPGYGTLKIAANGDELEMTLHGLRSRLKHFHYDVFEGVEDPLNPLSKSKVQFHTSLEGFVESAGLPVDVVLKPQIFRKVAGREMRQRSFLEPMTGEYAFGPVTATVSMQGDDTLTLLVPGQPRYELVPVEGARFQLKGLTAFSVEFKKGPSGAYEEAVFHQPNGTFAARRK